MKTRLKKLFIIANLLVPVYAGTLVTVDNFGDMPSQIALDSAQLNAILSKIEQNRAELEYIRKVYSGEQSYTGYHFNQEYDSNGYMKGTLASKQFNMVDLMAAQNELSQNLNAILFGAQQNLQNLFSQFSQQYIKFGKVQEDLFKYKDDTNLQYIYDCFSGYLGDNCIPPGQEGNEAWQTVKTSMATYGTMTKLMNEYINYYSKVEKTQDNYMSYIYDLSNLSTAFDNIYINGFAQSQCTQTDIDRFNKNNTPQDQRICLSLNTEKFNTSTERERIYEVINQFNYSRNAAKAAIEKAVLDKKGDEVSASRNNQFAFYTKNATGMAQLMQISNMQAIDQNENIVRVRRAVQDLSTTISHMVASQSEKEMQVQFASLKAADAAREATINNCLEKFPDMRNLDFTNPANIKECTNRMAMCKPKIINGKTTNYCDRASNSTSGISDAQITNYFNQGR